MALIDYIDPTTRRIYLSIDTVGASIHPIDIYKEVRTLRKNDETLRPFDMFLYAFGNVQKTTTSSTERYVETYSGARIVPYDVSHTLTITGTIITGEGTSGVYCFDRSLLSASTVVDINYIPPQVEVITVEATGTTAPEIAQELLETDIHLYNNQKTVGAALHRTTYIEARVYVNTEAIVNGDGSQTEPYNDFNDAKDFMELSGLSIMVLIGEVTIPTNFKNFTVYGIGSPIINCNGQDLKNSEFNRCELRGTYIDKIKAFNCILGDNFELNGGFNGCAVTNNLTCIDGGFVTMFDCFNNIANDGITNLSFNGVGTSKASIVNFHGHLNVSDINNALDVVNISMPSEHLLLDSSCTSGNISLAGFMKLTDNSGVNCIVDKTALIDPSTKSDVFNVAIL